MLSFTTKGNPLKKIITLFLFLSITQFSFGQQLRLKILSQSKQETAAIDSIGYQQKHPTAQSILDEIKKLKGNLLKKGYLSINTQEPKKINDSIFNCEFSLGNKTNSINIYIGGKNKLLNLKETQITITIQDVELYMNQFLKTLESKGYSLAKIRLVNFRNSNNHLLADLEIQSEKLRTLNDIVFNGFAKFPESHIKNLKRLYRNTLFNQETLKKLYSDVEKFRFAKQIKYPEILFTKDSTKVYIYLEKAKPNTFEGFIGFTNTDQKFRLNGYLDAKLLNILNAGEKFSIYWKSDGKNQKTFDLNTEIPYIFKSPLGIKAHLNIFKQDSTFQNARTELDLGYYFNYNTKVYVGYQSTESSEIQNLNSSLLSDYTNSFVTTHLDYTNYTLDDPLFPEKTTALLKIGFGKRNTSIATNQQVFSSIVVSHNLYLNPKNSINLKTQTYYLKSDQYITNELFRFGGINSIRGFSENSLQGNIFSSLLTEYRYAFNPAIYIHSIIDYGYSEDKTTHTTNKLVGLGIGLGLQTKNGLFHLIYANGSNQDQAIKLSNSIVHISFKTIF